LADADKLRVIGLISSYTLSEARMAHDAARATRQASQRAGGTSPPWSFDSLLRELVDERAYPRLYRIAWSDSAEASRSEDEEFMFGVERILDGVEALVERARRQE
jgi:Tetracyclin repressor-like, C-terminal domain